MAVAYPPRLALARTPTPLQALDRISAVIGGPRIWIKRDDLTGCADSGNKIRKLEFSLAEALRQGADTIITLGGVQSNHCRATAQLCARLGLKCHLLLRGADPGASVDGNLLLDRLFGASISFYRSASFQQQQQAVTEQWCQHYRDLGNKPYVIPIGASDEVGLWGYIAAAAELLDDFKLAGINPRHVICATGSGGTQGGLTLGMKLYDAAIDVWGINVCDDAAYFYHKISADVAAWQQRYQQSVSAGQLAINTLEGYVGAGYAVANEAVFACIHQLAQLEGIVLDPVYTGKAFYGLCEQLRQGNFGGSDDIVFVHTGGIFGLFAQREQLNAGSTAGFVAG